MHYIFDTLTHSYSQTGHCLQSVKEHRGLISDIQASADQMMVITASKDNSAKLFDADKLDLLKTFRTERPINSAAVSPIKDHVSLSLYLTSVSSALSREQPILVCGKKLNENEKNGVMIH